MNSPTENVAKWLDPPPNKNPTRPTKRRFFPGQLSNLSWQKVQQITKHHRIDFKKLLSYIHVNLIFNILLPSIV